MQYVAMMSKESPELLVSWLRNEYNPSGGLTVITVNRESDNISALVNSNLPDSHLPQPVKFIRIHPQRPDENRSLICELNVTSDDLVILPGFYPEDEAKFIPNGTFPKVQDNYKTFRILWHLGFRRYKTFNYGGSRIYSIPFLLDHFENKHKGQRAFIVGNGPSLNQIDMAQLKDEITFGSNRCYLGFEKWGFQFTYWGIMDRLQIEHYQNEYEDNVPDGMVKFFPFQYLPLFNLTETCPVPHKYGVKPGEPAFASGTDMLYLGWSVSYFLIQIAVLMGCNPIYLVGMDHTYSLDQRKLGMVDGNRWFDRNKTLRSMVHFGAQFFNLFGRQAKKTNAPQYWKASDADQPTHFDTRYTQGEEKLFVPPRPVYAEQAYAFARKMLEPKGIKILNATPGTALKEFDLVNFEDLF